MSSNSKKKSRMPELGEAGFCVIYLAFAAVAAVLFFTRGGSNPLAMKWGLLTLVLGMGDAFHLVPRIIKTVKGDSEKVQWWAGAGLMISSITMTIFYVILMDIWENTFPEIGVPMAIRLLVGATAILRIVLCVCPQNKWVSGGNPKWGIYRNAPFVITGICLVILFALSGNAGGLGLWKMCIAIVISFACYLPVVLWAKKKPMIGMLMMPKTLAYMWMISMGLGLILR